MVLGNILKKKYRKILIDYLDYFDVRKIIFLKIVFGVFFLDLFLNFKVIEF